MEERKPSEEEIKEENLNEVDSSEDEEVMLLRLEAERAKAEAEKMVARDNLKIKTIAKYKAIKLKQMQAFLDIE